MNKIAAASLFCFGLTAQADINMMEASFKTTFIDLQAEASPSALKISRTYDSRSTYSGMFGFGWCSTLDVSIVQVGSKAALRECGTTSKSLITRDRDHYIRRKDDGTLQRFAVEDGRLTGIANPGHKEVRILRARRSLPQATAAEEGGNKRREVRLELDDRNRVVRIESSGPDPAQATLKATFLYGPEGNLLSARNSWNNDYSYEYDPLHNLTQISYPDRTTETLTYDPDRDRVLSFQGRNGCNENYRYTAKPELKNRNRFKQTSVAILTCPHDLAGQTQTQTTYDFLYAKRADQRWALSQLQLTTADGKSKTLKYKLGGLQ